MIPGSVTIGATVGAASKEMTDDGKGVLSGAGVGIGFIDYVSGFCHLVFDTAPDDDSAITAGYSHDAGGKAKAAAVARRRWTPARPMRRACSSCTARSIRPPWSGRTASPTPRRPGPWSSWKPPASTPSRVTGA